MVLATEQASRQVLAPFDVILPIPIGDSDSWLESGTRAR